MANSEDVINEKLFEKLRICTAGYLAGLKENVEILRAVTARLHSRVSSQDKSVREKTTSQLKKKKDNVFHTLMTLLECVEDAECLASAAGVVQECLSPKSGLARFSILRIIIDANASLILLKLLAQQYARETHRSDSFLKEIIRILGQLSLKDAKFGGRVKQLNVVPIFHYYLKVYYQYDNKLIISILTIFKSVSRNCYLMPVLVKDGVSTTLEKIFIAANSTPTLRLKLLLSIFSYLTRNAQISYRMVKRGLVKVFLAVFARWEKYEGKTRLKICTDAVISLQHICATKPGRSVIRKENGFAPFYRFCLSCPEDKIYDKLLGKVYALINVCLEKKELPLSCKQSPVQFKLPLPVVTFQVEYDSDEEEGDEGCWDDEEEEWFDADEEEDEGKGYKEKGVEQIVLPISTRRNSSELIFYEEFFTEFFTFSYDIHDKTFKRSLSVVNISLLDEIDIKSATRRTIYCKIANKVKRVGNFVKVAYPDMMGGEGVRLLQPFSSKDRKFSRSDQSLSASMQAFAICNNKRNNSKKASVFKRAKLITCVDQGLAQNHIYNNVVYDLDKLTAEWHSKKNVWRKLSNEDETRVGIKDALTSTLIFESRFESGNLRKAVQVGAREYDLILSPDVNSSQHCQWFYFEVSNMDNLCPYVFNVINCEKSNSQFNYGMKVLAYSVREATLGRGGWSRMGSDISYYRNTYRTGVGGDKDKSKNTYFTTSFALKFLHSLDVCYVAYTFPYTYTQLLRRLKQWSEEAADKNTIFFKTDHLCDSLNGNSVPVVTITAPIESEISNRELIFLTSRVHPGEANSSWVIDGVITFLLGQTATAEKLRKRYVFKIVPMLNVEGVVNGCHRCGLTNEDLNRKWSNPSSVLHPAIFHTKGLLEYCSQRLKKIPYVYCDFHGHSRKKNVFLFGCSHQKSWLDSDRTLPDMGIEYLWLPLLMEHCSPAFDLESCTYTVERNRESTARVTVWREFGVCRSYTLETSYCGCDRGPYKGYHFDSNHLQEIGSNFCTALAFLHDESKWRSEMTLAKQDNSAFIAEFELRLQQLPQGWNCGSSSNSTSASGTSSYSSSPTNSGLECAPEDDEFF